MSYPPYASKIKCQWCSRQTERVKKRNACSHTVCDRCCMTETGCRSDCPLCWEASITHSFMLIKFVLSVVLELKSGEPPFPCSNDHPHCRQCSSDGCLLCQFRELQAWNDKKYRELSPNTQRILYTCVTWQTKFEQSPLTIPKPLKHDKESLSSIQHDNDTPDMSGGSSKSNVAKSSPIKKELTTTVETGDCMICLERLGSSFKTLPYCKHRFHQSCIEQWFQSSGKQTCPTCGHVYGISKGPQPANGRMLVDYLPTPLPGFDNVHNNGPKQGPTIEITYVFPSGIQGPLNPYPNRPFTGTTRKAYLPNNKEGREILQLLQRAFNDQHIFTIGRSSTTGQENVVTWNDIHHKTSIYGGPDRFGYPDPTYLLRVRQELADKGYK